MRKSLLDFKTLSNLEQDQYSIGEIVLDVEKEKFPIKYDKKFKDSKIQELVKEWMLIKENVKDEVNMYDMSFILILKHFTDVPFDEIEEINARVEHYVRMTNLLLDLKDNEGISLFEKIFSVINKEQILKVTTTMNRMAQNIIQQTKELQESEEYKKIQDYLKASEENE